MMTTMAALLGAVPLMLSHGTGSELRQPLGYTMFGGLLVSQALTLFTTPVIYLYLDRLSNWLSGGSGKGTSKDQEPDEPAPEPLSGQDAGAGLGRAAGGGRVNPRAGARSCHSRVGFEAFQRLAAPYSIRPFGRRPLAGARRGGISPTSGRSIEHCILVLL